MDLTGKLYFVSNRKYQDTLSTIYQSKFTGGEAADVRLVQGISKLKACWVNFDVEVTADGQSLYFVDSRFDRTGHPQTANLAIAEKSGAVFQRLPNSGELLKNINTDALEYGACISADQLELYFTRVNTPLTADSAPEIFVSTRKNINESFGIPSKISAITGFAEAPTISPDGQTLYFHKKENDKFALYMVRKRKNN